MDFSSYAQHVNLTNVGMVFQLAILEGLLSFDNALALAALVSSRLSHPEDRKHALLWGIWGAYILRIAIVFVGVWLMEHQWVKFLAGGYLIWLAVNELFFKKHGPEEIHALEDAEAAINKVGPEGAKRATWQQMVKVILAVELMDLMFSIDSIAVALAVSKETWVLIGGAVLGIMMMRIAAQYFIKLIAKYPILEPTAFVLVGLAGIKVVLEIDHIEWGSQQIPWLGLHTPEYLFLPVMASILIGAVVYNHLNPEKFQS